MRRSRVALLAVATLVALAAPTATGISLAATSGPEHAASSGTHVGKPAAASPRVAPGGPVAVDMTSTGVGVTPQPITPEVPTGDTLAMLDPAGSVVTSNLFPGEGAYVLNTLAGTITFTPAYGYSGTPISSHLMRYRVTDTSALFALGLYTPTVTKPVGPSASALTSTGLVNTKQAGTATPLGQGSVVDLLTVTSPVPVDGFTGVVPVVTPVSAAASGTGVLPVTGFDVARLSGLALLLLVAGIATTALSRRKPRR